MLISKDILRKVFDFVVNNSTTINVLYGATYYRDNLNLRLTAINANSLSIGLDDLYVEERTNGVFVSYYLSTEAELNSCLNRLLT